MAWRHPLGASDNKIRNFSAFFKTEHWIIDAFNKNINSDIDMYVLLLDRGQNSLGLGLLIYQEFRFGFLSHFYVTIFFRKSHFN